MYEPDVQENKYRDKEEERGRKIGFGNTRFLFDVGCEGKAGENFVQLLVFVRGEMLVSVEE